MLKSTPVPYSIFGKWSWGTKAEGMMSEFSWLNFHYAGKDITVSLSYWNLLLCIITLKQPLWLSFFRETVKIEQQICNSMFSHDLLLKLATCAVQTVARKSQAVWAPERLIVFELRGKGRLDITGPEQISKHFVLPVTRQGCCGQNQVYITHSL
jgi:hypothetical protein